MKDPRVYLAQILERIQRIEAYIKSDKESFLGDHLIQDAVIRNLEVIGEAAKRVPEEFKKAHSEIPWRGMTALRNVLIHGYEGVDLQKVWQVIEKELPPLEKAIKSYLPPLENLEAELAGEPIFD